MTKDIPQHHLVTLALYMAGGEDRFVDTEDIAIKSHELAPGRFSWRKYPDQINLELVRVFLSDAKKPDKGGLVSGSGRKGWTLTPIGLKWVNERGKKVLEAGEISLKGAERAGSVDSVRKSRELQRIQSTSAWQKWESTKGGITAHEANEVFRIDSYSKGDMLTLKFDRLQKTFIGDEDISEFLQELRSVVLAGDEK